MDKFDDYIRRGRQAIQTHPDQQSGGVDDWTAAKDVIGDILHAVCGRTPLRQGALDNAEALAMAALRGFEGDYEDMDPQSFKVGDVVYVEGASAILGDVIAVDDDGVEVTWRTVTTTEQPDDLTHAGGCAGPLAPGVGQRSDTRPAPGVRTPRRPASG